MAMLVSSRNAITFLRRSSVARDFSHKILFSPESTRARDMDFDLSTPAFLRDSRRSFAKAKKSKDDSSAASKANKGSSLSKEIKSTTVVGANILKGGSDLNILPDSEYSDCLWHLVHKRPALSELTRKDVETLPYDDLKRFVKLDTRAKIKDNNSLKARN